MNDDAAPVIDDITSINSTCGSANGEASVTVSGGDGNYTYEWDDTAMQTTATATGLSAGTYNVTVTDGNNCTVIGSIAVNDDAAPVIDDITSTNSTCGTANGEASVTVSGGDGNYTYEWDDTAMQTTATCLLYTSPSPRDKRQSRMPSSA